MNSEKEHANQKQSTQTLLSERAKQLAQELPIDTQDRNTIEVLLFCIGNEQYGIEVDFLKKVVLIDTLTPIPSLPNFYEGIINIHGLIVPVLNIAKFFDIKHKTETKFRKAVIVHFQNSHLGILAEEVLGISLINKNEIQSSLSSFLEDQHKYLKGVTPSQMGLLDLNNIFGDKRIQIDQTLQ